MSDTNYAPLLPTEPPEGLVPWLAKHATNTRASGSDDALKLTPPKDMSLEECLEFIVGDELVEVTPNHLRMRKRILNTSLRAKAESRKKQQ